MKTIKFLSLIFLFSLFVLPSLAQSSKKMSKYLMQSWVSAARIREADTTAMENTEETLNLMKDGKMEMTGQGSEMTGTWSYDEENKQLVLELLTMDGNDMSDRQMKVALDILQAKDKILTISKKGSRTLIYVLEGSNIKF